MKTVQRWSTDDIAPDRRLSFWRNAVHESVVEMDLRPTDHSPTFVSSIEACPLAAIVPHQARGSAQKVSRGSAEIARGQKNAYYLLSQPQRAWSIRHAGQEHFVEPGESVLVDSREPYDFLFAHGLDDLSVEMPIDWLQRWLPQPASILGRPLQCQSGWGKALRGFKEALIPERLVALGVPDILLEDQLGVLLSLASEQNEQNGPAVSAKNDLLRQCLRNMRERLADPELVALTVAEANAISVRSLHRVFAASNQTFSTVLMHLRVDDAARMLASRRFHTLTIAEISRRCGFLDPSHFARQFRLQRGVSPRAFRSAA
jgi:AraC family transcriptional regulator, positive regulator of tynA and feaB